MAAAQNPMHALFKKLQDCGFNRTFVKKMLPDWWDDSIAATPAGLQQITLILGQLLGIRPDSLWMQGSNAVFALPESRKFKRRSDLDIESLDVACALAFSAARMAQTGLQNKLATNGVGHAIPLAQELRQALLREAKWIGLPELLDYSFSLGIIVIYLDQFPSNARKMDGLAFDCQGHPTIVLTKRASHGALMFDLAHELGHIALHHLIPGGCIVDQEINGDGNAIDADEQAANAFALELLTGKAKGRIQGHTPLTGFQLANEAQKIGQLYQIHPSHVVLNYGHTEKQWPVAMTAIKHIAGNSPSDQDLIRQKLFASLDQDDMNEDDWAVLAWMTGKDRE